MDDAFKHKLKSVVIRSTSKALHWVKSLTSKPTYTGEEFDLISLISVSFSVPLKKWQVECCCY